MSKTVEEKYMEGIMREENALVFARFNKLVNNLFSEKSEAQEEILALKSQINTLQKSIAEHKREIANLKLKKQDFLEKSKEIQKESVKIVANKAKKSTDSVEIKKTITELIQEIDACIALLNEE
jgi:predicted  nucleic acid-binding Zn-ribbon protein